MADFLSIENVADQIRRDFKAAYDQRITRRRELSEFMTDPTLSVELAGARAHADMMLAECTWEAFAYISKHLHNATGHPAGADPDITSFTNREVLAATMKARADAEGHLMYDDFSGSVGGIPWTLAHRHGDRAFLMATVPARMFTEQSAENTSNARELFQALVRKSAVLRGVMEAYPTREQWEAHARDMKIDAAYPTREEWDRHMEDIRSRASQGEADSDA